MLFRSQQVLAVIRKVAAGGVYLSPAMAERMAREFIPASESPPHTLLSDREYQVFDLIVGGHSVSAIAERLSLSVKTVSTHKSNILRKMNMTNQAELIRYALRHRLTGDDAPLR